MSRLRKREGLGTRRPMLDRWRVHQVLTDSSRPELLGSLGLSMASEVERLRSNKHLQSDDWSEIDESQDAEMCFDGYQNLPRPDSA